LSPKLLHEGYVILVSATKIALKDISPVSIVKFGAPGDILILISAVNWAVVSVSSRRGLKSYAASLMTFYLMTFGWLFTSLLFFGSGHYAEIAHLSFNSRSFIGRRDHPFWCVAGK
jgi:hypothetical protein